MRRWKRPVRQAAGELAIWLLGGSGDDNSGVAFNLTKGVWTPVTTCVTATPSRSDIRVQFYPVADAGTIGIDAVQIR